jgi:4-hydroxybenzoate polyprenyltransferase
MNDFLLLIRAKQYIKNLIIFLPLFFSAQLTEPLLFYKTLVAFIAFSLCASGVYIFNDIQDVDFDRKHPEKKNRPIASGAVSVKSATLLMCLVFLVGFSVMFVLSTGAAIYTGVYVLLNIAYSLYLKHIAILDVNIIAVGFVLRLFVGAEVTHTTLSMWIIIMIFLLALFVALAKRRDDVLVYMDTGNRMRKVVDGYNLNFIDSAMAILASVVVVSYLLYTTSTEIITRLNSEYIYLTTFFVILGVLRYLQITFVEKLSGDPVTIFLNDRFLKFTMLGWVLVFLEILYW